MFRNKRYIDSVTNPFFFFLLLHLMLIKIHKYTAYKFFFSFPMFYNKTLAYAFQFFFFFLEFFIVDTVR